MNIDLQLGDPMVYRQDYPMRIEDVVQQLRHRDFDPNDWQNLMEEIADLAKIQRRVKVLLVHLLKRCYLPLPHCYRLWEIIITNQRDALGYSITDPLNLSEQFHSLLEKTYLQAWKVVALKYPETSFPDQNPFPANLLLTASFWSTSDD